jgi:hypothetical protein
MRFLVGSGGRKLLTGAAVLAGVALLAVALGGGDARAGQSHPGLPSGFGPDAVWNPDTSAVRALHQCSPPTMTCVQGVMEQAGASEDAIAFYHLTGWFLGDIQDTGVVQLGTVVNPWRANENSQPALLGGTPAVVMPEIEIETANLAGSVQRDPNYQAVAAAHPDAMFWGHGPRFEGIDTSPQDGPRFVFVYPVLDGCHACAVLAGVRLGFDFAPDGSYTGAHLLSVEPAPGP